MNHARKVATALLLLVLSACAGTSGPSKQELILGSWQADFQGQSIVLVYSATEVSVESFGVAFPYEWLDENQIRMDAMGQIVTSTVEFTNPNEMVQSSDQGVQTLRRVQ
ncbi:MAG: hypothetical protein V4751_04060 [Pseudomonadota bacterium]